MEGYNHSQYLPVVTPEDRRRFLGQCLNSNDYSFDREGSTNLTARNGGKKSSLGDAYCDEHAHFCHRISASHMHYLHQQM